MWANAIKDIETGEIELVTAETKAPDLDRVERHTVPCTKEGDEIVFGVHTFSRNCICRPVILDDYGYEIVLHKNRKAN